MAAKYYRGATLAAIEALTLAIVQGKASGANERLTNERQVRAWLLHQGPVRLRFRWHKGMTAGARDGRVDVVGEKGARASCVLVGYDGEQAYPYRLLTPFGSGFGQAGRCWLSEVGLAKLVREGAAFGLTITVHK